MSKRIKAIPTPNLEQSLSAKLLGEAIKARRTQSNLRLEDAALLCKVAKQTLMNIEQGQETTQINTILQICQGLGIKLFIAPWTQAGESDEEWR